ncbi:MAG TPA: hypothetical protein VMK65_04610, partial [Longimicrobiales bacterium]|nr:hypothetical protein [Longimicrobiales bacterium]
MRLEGRGEPNLDAHLRRLLAEPGLRVVATDTLIARGDTVRGPLLILGARVLMNGVVEGTLGAVDANLFLRPFARVQGDLVSVAGGLYPSALARVEGEVVDAPLATYTLRREGEGWVIVAHSEGERRLVLEGPLGLGPPTYDRVSGLSLRAGGRYRLPVLAGVAPSVGGYAVYRSARGA